MSELDDRPQRAVADTCSSCRAPIWWVVTVTGEKLPLDYAPDAEGPIEMAQIGGAWRAHVLVQRESLFDVGERRYWRPHRHRS